MFGLTPIVVPNERFYRIDTALLVPRVDLATWRLRVHGLVDRETYISGRGAILELRETSPIGPTHRWHPEQSVGGLTGRTRSSCASSQIFPIVTSSFSPGVAAARSRPR